MTDTLAIMPTYMKNPSDLLMTQKAIKTLKETSDVDLIVIDDGSPNRGLANDLLVWQMEAGVSFELRLKPNNEGFSKTVNIGMYAARYRRTPPTWWARCWSIRTVSSSTQAYFSP
jgi:hypothetical protein